MLPTQVEIQDTILSIFKKYEDLKKNNSNVAFDVSLSYKIIDKTIDILKKEPPILQINTKKMKKDFVIVGDVHGNLESILTIFDIMGHPKNTKYLFLGDYVDRGNNSCEVIILLYSMKCLYPDNIYLLRGNHEFRDINEFYGFKDECISRVKRTINGNTFPVGKQFFTRVTDSFAHLPICAILNDDIFCVHGGISSLLENRQELLSIQKVGVDHDYNNTIQTELMWNDPIDSTDFYDKSERGVGFVFGREALNSFLKKMKFKLIIRSHQMEDDGYNWPFGESGGILTVFSSIDYCGSPNSAALAVVCNKKNESNDLVKVTQIQTNSDPNHYFKIVAKLLMVSRLMKIFS